MSDHTKLHSDLCEIITEHVFACMGYHGEDDGPCFNADGVVFRARDLVALLSYCGDEVGRRELLKAVVKRKAR
jgi:hypothetical protein